MASGDLALTHAEAEALRASNYPCPPGYLCPPGWRLSAGGVPVSPGPQGTARRAAITHHYYVELTPEQRMDPRWDLDNTATWDAFFFNRWERELARYEGDGPPPVDNNEAGRRLWWGGRTLEGVMNHILAGDYPRLRYPHFQPPNKGGSGRGGFAIRAPSPPQPTPEFPGQRVAIRASLEPPLPSPVDYGRSWWEKEEQAYRARRGDDGQGCSRYGHLSPQRAQPQPLRMQPPPPHRFQPLPASDDDDSDDGDGEFDDFEYMYYRTRQEYD